MHNNVITSTWHSRKSSSSSHKKRKLVYYIIFCQLLCSNLLTDGIIFKQHPVFCKTWYRKWMVIAARIGRNIYYSQNTYKNTYELTKYHLTARKPWYLTHKGRISLVNHFISLVNYHKIFFLSSWCFYLRITNQIRNYYYFLCMLSLLKPYEVTLFHVLFNYI